MGQFHIWNLMRALTNYTVERKKNHYKGAWIPMHVEEECETFCLVSDLQLGNTAPAEARTASILVLLFRTERVAANYGDLHLWTQTYKRSANVTDTPYLFNMSVSPYGCITRSQDTAGVSKLEKLYSLGLILVCTVLEQLRKKIDTIHLPKFCLMWSW